MPEYLSPGVYVEEVPSAIKPIAGVSTSTASFIGVISGPFDIPVRNPKYDPTGKNQDADSKLPYKLTRFPAADKDTTDKKAALDAQSVPGVSPPQPKDNKPETIAAFNKALDEYEEVSLPDPGQPILCTSFSEFKRHFGDFSLDPDQNKLVHGVYGFFNNGGTRCFVVRFATEGDIKAADALKPLEAIDEVSLVVAPGITELGVQRAIVDHCTNMADRFAILDAPEVKDADMTSDKLKQFNSDYAAVYFPRIRVFDMPTQLIHPDGDGEISVAVSGHMTGICSRVDHERGVHKAPANEVVRGALHVEHQVSKPVQDGLNPDGINCIRYMNGDIRVWGARTIGGDANQDLKYINVRRLLLFLRKSIDHGTQWVVFEPNDRTLWAKIVRNVTAFLTTVWRDGALFGSTPQEAFYVKCDDETNPPEERDLGRVTTEIGVAIVRPAEFVIFRISQWSGPQGQQ